jgi:hypothetical protein
VGDDGYFDLVAGNGGYGEADAFDGDGALGYDVAGEGFGELDAQAPVCFGGVRGDGVQGEQSCSAVDVTLDDVASEGRAGGGGEFEVQDCVGTQVRERGAGDGLSGEIGGEAWGKGVGLDAESGEADAVDGDAVTGVQARRECGRGDGDAGRARGGRDGEKGSGGFDQAGEHDVRLSDLLWLWRMFGWRPRVAEVADDGGVWTVGCPGDAMERLLEEVGGGDPLGEGDGLVAQFGFGVDEDGFVDQVLPQEGAVEVRAAFEEEAEDVALGEGGENDGEAEASGVIGDFLNLDAEIAECGGL